MRVRTCHYAQPRVGQGALREMVNRLLLRAVLLSGILRAASEELDDCREPELRAIQFARGSLAGDHEEGAMELRLLVGGCGTGFDRCAGFSKLDQVYVALEGFDNEVIQFKGKAADPVPHPLPNQPSAMVQVVKLAPGSRLARRFSHGHVIVQRFRSAASRPRDKAAGCRRCWKARDRRRGRSRKTRERPELV